MKRLILICLSLLFLPGVVFAEACSDKSGEAKVVCLSEELTKLSSQKKTLANQIAQFDAQIKLTVLKINQTEEKIALLGGRINQLEVSLDSLTKAFASRAVETYKISKVGNNLLFLLSAEDLNQAVFRFHYLRMVQAEDGNLLQRLQVVQTNYQVQKKDQEDLQAELDQQKANLDSQKSAKAALLLATKNDEVKYQQQLAEAIAQLNISRGLGKESYLRDVLEGENIGAIINSASGCSSGAHLHFEVHKDGNLQNPSDFLRSITFSYSYGSGLYGYFGTINPHGSWDWPINEPITINQGFGSTGYARDFGYQNFVHPGIDIQSSNPSVRSVKRGKLYRGSIQCGGKYPGTLSYAKVEQDGGAVVYYEHVYVQ